MKENKVLDPHDLGTSTWRKLSEYAEARIESIHKELESDADDRKTSILRGRIKELRRLLELGKPPIV